MGDPRGRSDAELVRAALEGAPVRVAVFDRAGRLLPSDSGAPGDGDFFELYEDTPGLRDAVQMAVSGRESRITRVMDDATHVVRFIPRRGPGGAVENVIGVATVLAAGAAEEAQRELRVRERSIFNSSMFGLLYWDEQGAITDANDVLLEMIGYTREDLALGRLDSLARTSEGHRVLDRRALAEIRERGRCIPFEKEFVRKDGTRSSLLIGGASLGPGSSAGVAFVIDNSKRKRQEREGREAESKLARVLEALPIVLWSIDADGKLLLSAGSGLRAQGLENGQIVGQSLFELYAHVPTALDAVRRALRGEQCSIEAQDRGLTLETMFIPQRDEAGDVTGVLGITVDVTERRRAEAEQERLRAQMLHVQKLESLGLLAGGIAHDFNNVLAAIVGGASAALLMMPPGVRAREHLEGVVDSAQRAASLTRQMLAYAGKGQVEVRPLDLSRYVLELAPLLEASIPKTVQLEFELQAGLPAIPADVAQIQQVAMNLVINGAEAVGDRNGTVRVLTRARSIDELEASTLFSAPERAGRYVVLEVQDTGHGMDAATRSKIFDPFFSTKFTGRGLGLAAVDGIVRAHRGAIHLDSTPGRGTSFQVFFPAANASGAGELVADSLDFRGHGLALLVDDDRAVRKITARLLELFGFTVIEARDGRAGLEAFVQRAGDIVVVLLDMTMPMMGGEQTLRAIRQVRADVPILVMSGYDESEMSRAVTSSGIDGFLAKPFTSDALARKLKSALGSRR